jgi:hypothetical protein
MWHLLFRLARPLLTGRRIGLGGALVTALGLGAYSSVAPETEARTIYQILRPVVQNNANEIVALRLRLDYLEQALEMQKARSGDASIAPDLRRVPSTPKAANPIHDDGAGNKVEEAAPRAPRAIGAVGDAAVSVPPQLELPTAPWKGSLFDRDGSRLD